jgi:hypothetical protein
MRGLPRTLQRAALRELGAQPAVAGLTRTIKGGGGSYQLIFTFKAMAISVTDALAYASQKLFDFPQGRVYIKGGTATLAFAVTSARAGTINDNAAMDWSVGTAAASATALATTMVDIVAKQDHTLDGAVAAYTAAITANAEAAAFFDGTATAKDIYLNVSFPTGTDIDADGTLAVNGTITLNVEVMGDV